VIAALLALALATAPVAEPKDAKAVDVVVVVDLNNASALELCTLPGIGPKKAEAIVAMRSKHAFTRVTQLLQVKGIGPKTLDRLKSRVRLGPVATPTAAVMPPPALPLPALAPLARPSA
jgi:competence protein ComEA